nr:hypothetical protein [Candidatus Phytoplasma tritici]
MSKKATRASTPQLLIALFWLVVHNHIKSNEANLRTVSLWNS